MAKHRTCDNCGAALDFGEVCDCKKEQAAAQEANRKAREAAMREGIQADVLIHLEKKAGSETFERKIEASSASAALNGIAVLIAEYSKITSVPVVRVLAVLAATMTAPAIREEQAEKEG